MTRSRDEDPLDDSGGPSSAPGPPHPRVPMLSPSSPSFLSSSAFVLPTVIVILVYSLLGIPPLTSADANKTTAPPMSDQERALLRDESREMFYHAYNSYLSRAFPADELMPMSCKGRFRGREINRGDIDDAMGNFSLTLIDSLDTILIMGDIKEFEHGVRLVIDHVTFDHDISVSVFETNIRIVGGLLSAHVLSEYLRDRHREMTWYQGELLNMATEIGYRLLPAFNSSTGLPHPRVNLRHGIKAGKVRAIGETCTACAGTMILEFAALSRLSGEPIFEEKASHAMDVLWSSRHRMSNLVGNVLNINTGDWVRRDSGVGAGIDSYYEYVAKAYVLLGEDKYLDRWTIHYEAIMKYLGQGHLLQDVHMHRPHSNSKHFVDALGAFWPGLQVLMGDVKPAVESHEILYQVMERHHFLPEAFTMDYQVHWGQHLLRPEFVESTYFLYKATEDPHYLEVGKKALKALQKYARVPCGFATIKDVRTLQKEDRMDSFVLAETFKYLYLLFANDSELLIDVNDFVFTTEAHLLPLSLARLSNKTAVPLRSGSSDAYDEDVEFARSCPSTEYLFPHKPASFVQELRTPLANIVNEKCPVKKIINRKLFAADFKSGDVKHMALIKNMGINLVSLPDGRVQLMHTHANAKSPEEGEEGLLFMQEMIELSKQATALPDTPPRLVKYTIEGEFHTLLAGPAQFGLPLENGASVSNKAVIADPVVGCSTLKNEAEFWGKIAIVERGSCMFVEKARNLESLGVIGGIVIDNVPDSTAEGNPLFAMSGDGTDDVSIPFVFLFAEQGRQLIRALEQDPDMTITIQDAKGTNGKSPNSFVNFKNYVINNILKTGAASKPSPPHQAGPNPLPPTEIKDKRSDEEDGEGSESGGGIGLTNPVSSLLERSKKQVEHYFSGTQDEVEAKEEETSSSGGSSSSKVELSDGGEDNDSSPDEVFIHFYDPDDPDDRSTILASKTRVVTEPDGSRTKVVHVQKFIQDKSGGTIEVFELSDMEIEKLMELQEEEKAKHSGEKASKVKIELEKEEIEDDITLIPSVLPIDDVENYIDLERINRILTLTDQHNDEVNSILRAHVLGKIDPTRFIVFEDKDLTKMLLQVMWEDEKIDLEAALGVVADLVGNHDREEAAMLIDEGVSLFVEEVIAKTEKGMYKKAQAIVLSSMDSKSESELLGGFLDRVLSSAGGEKALVGRQVSGELIRKYLAVNPVMTEVFAKIKENIIIGIPRKKENSTEKEEL